MTHKKEYIRSGEEISEYNKNYYREHKGKLKKTANTRLEINPELNKDYYQKNREKILKQKREHYKKNKMNWKRIECRFKGIEYLKFVKSKTDGLIDLLAYDIEELEQLNPLGAHIVISQILGEIIPILEELKGGK